MIRNLEDLMALARVSDKRRIAVAAAEDADVIDTVARSEIIGELDFTLIGDAAKIKALMDERELSSSRVEIIDLPSHEDAAAKAVELAREGYAGAIMKGNLHTSIFFKAMLHKEKGIRRGGLLSQVSVYDKPFGDGLLLATDCAMAISPTLEEKVSIVENAVVLARALGCEVPKVAMLSAIEVVNPKIPDTFDAAIISKMADRGQIKHCIVDGPFALDNAVSVEAAKHKGITSPVAGRADVLIAPNLQVGNVLHKAIGYFGGRPSASAVMGAALPVIATSRTDSVESKLYTIALALYLARKNK